MFLFFKQKTAYEMRISDWSSDVCSSDLPLHVALAGMVVQADQCVGRNRKRAGADRYMWVAHPDQVDHERHRENGAAATDQPEREADDAKIGRATCRERVCQDVDIQVVAGTLKNKTENITMYKRST